MIDFFFEEFSFEQLVSGARVANPASRNILEKCGFQWSGVELHRFEALGSSTPVDCFRLSRSGGRAEELEQFDAAGGVDPLQTAHGRHSGTRPGRQEPTVRRRPAISGGSCTGQRLLFQSPLSLEYWISPAFAGR